MEEQKTSLPMRSGPGVAPVVGTPIVLARDTYGNPLCGKPRKVDQEDMDSPEFHRLWNAHCYDLGDTQQPAPAHVCKGRPCGELCSLTDERHFVRPWTSSYCSDGFLRGFCSPACRDAWKPEATAVVGTCGAVLGGGDYCLRAAGTDGACDRHQLKAPPAQPPAPPSPAPWKCSQVDCKTPGSPRPEQGGHRCVACIDTGIAKRTARHQRLVGFEGLPTFHVPGSIPARPLGWSHPPEWKPGDDSSIWSE